MANLWNSTSEMLEPDGELRAKVSTFISICVWLEDTH